MPGYDYKRGKLRVEEILNHKLEKLDEEKFPNGDNILTFTNGYYSFVSAIFVDIRDSTTLFSCEDKEKVSKVIRAFTSEVIEILRNDDNCREIGIRGDCVYGIYTTPQTEDVYEVAYKAFIINTYMRMLNKLLEKHRLPNIAVGIGMSTDRELIIKAGRKDTGINSKVWIGRAVTKASKFSSIANKFVVDHDNKILVVSECSYNNFIKEMEQDTSYDPSLLFEYYIDENNEGYYTADVVDLDFDGWINDGMRI